MDVHFFLPVSFITVCNWQCRLSTELHGYQQALSPNLPSCSQDPTLQTSQSYVHGVLYQHKHHSPGQSQPGDSRCWMGKTGSGTAIQPTLS